MSEIELLRAEVQRGNELTKQLIQVMMKRHDRAITAGESQSILGCSYPTFRKLVVSGKIKKRLRNKYSEAEVYGLLMGGFQKGKHSKK
jgi:hypothetical protein